MTLRSRFPLWLSLGLLAGCGGGAPTLTEVPLASPSAGTPAPPAAEKKSRLFDFRAVAVPLEQPNQYRVDLKWDPTMTGRCLVDREDIQRNERLTFPEMECNVATISDERSTAGRRYRYRLRALELVGTVGESTTEIQVPRDLAIRGEQVVPSLDGISRLFLLKGAKLRTEGLPWRGNLDELIAEDAVIELFPEAQLGSAAGADARSTGPIELRVRRARGSLFLRLVGQNGGDGIAGNDGSAGKNGTDGKDADVDVNPEFINQLPVLVTRREEFRKFAWEGQEFPGNVKRMMKCIRPATAGTDGADGTAGGAGGAGGRGGNTPRTLVLVENGEHFRWSSPRIVGGRGGLGGSGGKAGAGGKAGTPGATDKTGICPEVKPAKDGKDGLRGADGAAGKDGREEPVCVVIAGSRSGECESFADALER